MPNGDERNPKVRYEHRDIWLKPVVLTGVGTITGTIVVVLGLWFYYELLRRDSAPIEARTGVAEVFNRLRTPRLQESPVTDWEEMRAQQLKALHSYGWVDRQQSKFAMPIDRAIDLLVKRGMQPPGDYSQYELRVPSAGHLETGFDLQPRR